MKSLIPTLSVLVFALAAVLVTSPAHAEDPVAAGKKIFMVRCQTCHGATGVGDGPASASLKPKPRNFTDKAWQESVTDEKIMNTFQKGGAAVGLSPMMPPHPDLKGEKAKAIVAFIRSLGK